MSEHQFSERFTFAELTKEETPLRILHSTMQEIGTHGLTNLTTKNISQRANLSTGIIHHYFNTKDNLVYAAYVYLVRDLHQCSLTIGRTESDPKKRLLAMISMNFTSTHVSPEARNMWPQFWAHAAHDARVERLLRAYHRRYHSNLTYNFRHLLNDPEKAKIAANLLLSSIHGVWFFHRFNALPPEPEQAIKILETQLEALLKAYG